MKCNKNGFIATSILYSFFLVFVMTLLTIIGTYAHNRILLNSVKKTTMEELNSLSEKNLAFLDKRSYSKYETVSYAGETWNVISDDGNSVKLILSSGLTWDTITSALSYAGIYNVSSGNRILMCSNTYLRFYCSYAGSEITQYNYYNWNNSLAKVVVEYWYNNHMYLQKYKDKEGLQLMSFSDNAGYYYNEYIRIPLSGEYNDASTWSLTLYSTYNGISYININSSSVTSYTNYKTIRPVISVKKAS